MKYWGGKFSMFPRNNGEHQRALNCYFQMFKINIDKHIAFSFFRIHFEVLGGRTLPNIYPTQFWQ
jgi:hypothetical protein